MKCGKQCEKENNAGESGGRERGGGYKSNKSAVHKSGATYWAN